jgi:uncharacterized membrane protein YdjX (TVP38/TMEM64 family)
MGIDGRTLLEKPKERDAYESAWVRAVSYALIWVPLVLLVVFAYVSGYWFGGVTGALLSVGSTIFTALAVWVYRRFFRRHRTR